MADNPKQPVTGDSDAWPLSHPVQPHLLGRKKPARFDVRPDAAEQAGVADFLGILSVEHLRFKGALMPVGQDDWRAEGRLTAVVQQSCVVTLAPVTQHIDEQIARIFVPAETLEDAAEVDLDADDADDPDGFEDRIDIGHLTVECLALALEPYPRADGAELPQSLFAPPGAEPLDEQSIKPFAKLAELRQKLGQSED